MSIHSYANLLNNNKIDDNMTEYRKFKKMNKKKQFEITTNCHDAIQLLKNNKTMPFIAHRLVFMLKSL